MYCNTAPKLYCTLLCYRTKAVLDYPVLHLYCTVPFHPKVLHIYYTALHYCTTAALQLYYKVMHYSSKYILKYILLNLYCIFFYIRIMRYFTVLYYCNGDVLCYFVLLCQSCTVLYYCRKAVLYCTYLLQMNFTVLL